MKKFYLQFKTPIVIIFLFFTGLFLYTNIAGPIPFFINSVTTTKNDLFSASGEGEVTAIPDEATLYAGVTQNAPAVIDAKNKANIAVNKVLEAIKALGINEKNIKTTSYNVTPNYGGGNEIMPMMYPIRDNTNKITSYTVTQNLEVKVKDIQKVNGVIDEITKSGANLVGGVNFTFSDELTEKLETQARKEAVTKAKKKAQNLANVSGIRLGKIINVIENSSGGRFLPMMATAKAEDAAPNPQTNITPGENTITIGVTIYYETR